MLVLAATLVQPLWLGTAAKAHAQSSASLSTIVMVDKGNKKPGDKSKIKGRVVLTADPKSVEEEGMRPLSRVEAIREKAKRKFLDNMDQNGRPAWNVPELGNVAPPQGEISYGAETPLPGREKEYEEFKAYESQAGAQGGAAASFSAPPPIDEERRNRSPGMVNNFYETSTADFRRPHGFRGAPTSDPWDESSTTSGAGGGGGAPGGGAGGAVPEFGAESPAPGREKEYTDFQAQSGGAQGMAGPAPPPPPIDEERRNRSPGMVNNFYDTSTADFKRPHGMRGAAPPAQEAPPPAGAAMRPPPAGVGMGGGGGWPGQPPPGFGQPPPPGFGQPPPPGLG